MKNILLFFYIIINVFLYILNFEVFNSQVDIDLGFGIYGLMPLVILQIIGLVFVLLFFFIGQKENTKTTNMIDRLEDKIMILEKDAEIASLKSINTLEKKEISKAESNKKTEK